METMPFALLQNWPPSIQDTAWSAPRSPQLRVFRDPPSRQETTWSALINHKLDQFNNASNEYHLDVVFDAPARMVGRFEIFLRDDVRRHAPCCGKGQRIVLSAIFKTFFKNARIGTRTHAREEWSQRGSNPRGIAEPLLHCLCNRGSHVRPAPGIGRTPVTQRV